MTPLDAENLNQLIQGCQRQEAKSQKALFLLYSEALYATCVRYVGDEEIAKDVLQDSFLAIFQYIKSFDPSKGSLFTWMNKICIHQSLRQIKSKFTLLDVFDLPALEVPNKENNPEELVQIEELFHIIKNLPEPYRTVFNLFEIEGYSHFEIAEMLQIKEGSSRSILSRAKKLLVQHFTNLQLRGI